MSPFPTWLETADRKLMLLIHSDWSNSFFDRLLPIWRDRDTWVPFYLLLAIFLVYRYSWKGLWVVLLVGASVGATDYLSSSVIKPWVGRDRPCHEDSLQGEVSAMVYCGNSKSFTSSHAANHTAIAMALTLLWLKRRKGLVVLVFTWALIVGYAQVYVGVHYPLDILGGMLVGGLVAYLLCTIAIKSGLKAIQ